MSIEGLRVLGCAYGEVCSFLCIGMIGEVDFVNGIE